MLTPISHHTKVGKLHQLQMALLQASRPLPGISGRACRARRVHVCASFDKPTLVQKPELKARPERLESPPKRLEGPPKRPELFQDSASSGAVLSPPPTAQPPPPAAAAAVPAPLASTSSAAAAVEGGITVEYQRQRAKEMTKYFKELKAEQQILQKGELFGWTRPNEIANGRWVMFGLMVGMMTEYATGVDFPHQIALMASYLGVLDLE